MLAGQEGLLQLEIMVMGDGFCCHESGDADET
jgi:hypothetical protein